MYETFGARVTGSTVEFRLFLPDSAVDPAQYVRGGDPHIRSVRVVGDFQGELGQIPWDPTTAPELTRESHPNGWLYTFAIPQLADGFYQYM